MFFDVKRFITKMSFAEYFGCVTWLRVFLTVPWYVTYIIFQVQGRDVNKFQLAYCNLLKGNLDGLKKLKKSKAKSKAAQWQSLTHFRWSSWKLNIRKKFHIRLWITDHITILLRVHWMSLLFWFKHIIPI